MAHQLCNIKLQFRMKSGQWNSLIYGHLDLPIGHHQLSNIQLKRAFDLEEINIGLETYISL